MIFSQTICAFRTVLREETFDSDFDSGVLCRRPLRFKSIQRTMISTTYGRVVKIYTTYAKVERCYKHPDTICLEMPRGEGGNVIWKV